MRKKIYHLTYGAMMLAIMLAFLFIDVFLANNLLTLVGFVFPIPIIIYSKKTSLQNGLLLYFALVISCLLVVPLLSALLAMLYGLVGLGYSFLQTKFGDKLVLLGTFLLETIVLGFMLIILGALYGFSIIQDIQFIITLLPPQLHFLANTIVLLSYVMTALFETLLLHFLTQLLSFRLKLPLVKTTKFSDIKVNPLQGLILVLISLFFLVSDNYVINYISLIATFLLALSGHLFILKTISGTKSVRYSIIVLILTMSIRFLPHACLGAFAALIGKLK